MATFMRFGSSVYYFQNPSLFFFNFCLLFCSRGFNDAINGFPDDGWTLLTCDGAEDVIISCNSAKNFMATLNAASSLPMVGGVLCAKASMLLQVSPRDSILQTVILFAGCVVLFLCC